MLNVLGLRGDHLLARGVLRVLCHFMRPLVKLGCVLRQASDPERERSFRLESAVSARSAPSSDPSKGSRWEELAFPFAVDRQGMAEVWPKARYCTSFPSDLGRSIHSYRIIFVMWYSFL